MYWINKFMDIHPLRAASWWIRWNDLDWPSPDNMDAIQRRADEFAASGVNTAMVFGAHFRWDFMPFWTMLHDYMAFVRSELNARGIALFDHHSAILIHRYDTAAEMRNVKLHSGPHLPFSPDRRNAASWEFEGVKLNAWRRIDLVTGQPSWNPGYAAESFCFVNPEFVAAYCKYVKQLIADTAVDGLMCDDGMMFGAYHDCGCPACRERFLGRAGHPLPDPSDRGFWGNWENPEWRAYLDDRFAAQAEFYRAVRAALPDADYPMTACASSSCADDNVSKGYDLRGQLAGCNIVNLELCGNTPPGPLDDCPRFADRMIPVAHHLGIAAEHGVPSLAVGYGFIEDNANALWALVKALGGNCWFSTLKARLGLPESELAELPGDAEPAAEAYHFERENPGLFNGAPLHRCGIFFSYESRNHTAFGSMVHGYTRDFADTVALLLENGLLPGVLTEIPPTPDRYPLLVLPSAVRFTADELERLETYRRGGGVVIATGPCGFEELCRDWPLPMRISGDVFRSNEDWQGVWGGAVPPVAAPRRWREAAKNWHWHPGRLQNGELAEAELIRKIAAFTPPVEGLTAAAAQGFFMTAFRGKDDAVRLFFVATEYDVKIDADRDARRYHRSRVNLFTAAPPCGQNGAIELQLAPGWSLDRVLTPLGKAEPRWSAAGRIELDRPVVLAIAELRKH